MQHIANLAGNPKIVLPVPAFNVINGGSHAGNKLAMQACSLWFLFFEMLNSKLLHVLNISDCDWLLVFAGVYDSPCWSFIFQRSHENGC